MRATFLVRALPFCAVSAFVVGSAAADPPGEFIVRMIEKNHTGAISAPPLQERADRGDVMARCILFRLYRDGEAAPRKIDDVGALERSCVANTHYSDGNTAPPALTVPQHH